MDYLDDEFHDGPALPRGRHRKRCADETRFYLPVERKRRRAPPADPWAKYEAWAQRPLYQGRGVPRETVPRETSAWPVTADERWVRSIREDFDALRAAQGRVDGASSEPATPGLLYLSEMVASGSAAADSDVPRTRADTAGDEVMRFSWKRGRLGRVRVGRQTVVRSSLTPRVTDRSVVPRAAHRLVRALCQIPLAVEHSHDGRCAAERSCWFVAADEVDMMEQAEARDWTSLARAFVPWDHMDDYEQCLLSDAHEPREATVRWALMAELALGLAQGGVERDNLVYRTPQLEALVVCFRTLTSSALARVAEGASADVVEAMARERGVAFLRELDPIERRGSALLLVRAARAMKGPERWRRWHHAVLVHQLLALHRLPRLWHLIRFRRHFHALFRDSLGEHNPLVVPVLTQNQLPTEYCLLFNELHAKLYVLYYRDYLTARVTPPDADPFFHAPDRWVGAQDDLWAWSRDDWADLAVKTSGLSLLRLRNYDFVARGVYYSLRRTQEHLYGPAPLLDRLCRELELFLVSFRVKRARSGAGGPARASVRGKRRVPLNEMVRFVREYVRETAPALFPELTSTSPLFLYILSSCFPAVARDNYTFVGT